MLLIRPENSYDPAELTATRRINQKAFGGPEEADLIDQLRLDGAVLVTLVAELDRQVVGHTLFSRMSIESLGAAIPAVALAPVAVLPEFQRRGIGTELIRAGLALLRDRGEKIVIVVGHPDYYPRFGFSSEKAGGLESPFPRDAFMVAELSPCALDGVQGRVIYHAAFGIPT